MNKKLILTLLPMMLLCACKSSSSSRVPTVPTVTWTDTGSSSDTSTSTTKDEITGSVSVPTPDKTGAHEVTLDEVKEIAREMSEVQSSESFKLPDELVLNVKTSGSSDMEIEGVSSLSANEKCVFSNSNNYYRTEASGGDQSTKHWRYIGQSPVEGDAGEYYLDATSTNEEGTYSKEKVTDKVEKQKELRSAYEEEQLDILTGKSVLEQLNLDESDESARVDCKYFTKGNGSLIVYGEIVVNNYEFTYGDTTIKGSMKTAIAYTWDNYIITSGVSDALFKVNMIFDINGSMKTTQTVSFSPKSTDLSKPNYTNFTERE